MTKKTTHPKFRKVRLQTRQPKEWDMPASLKKALEQHEHWPHLKAKDW